MKKGKRHKIINRIGHIRRMGPVRFITLLENEKGIALVMVLVLSMIALAMVSAMLFMLTQGTRMSGYHKIFRSADEAGIGCVAAAREMVTNRGWPSMTPTIGALPFGSSNVDACLDQKLKNSRGIWATTSLSWSSCSNARLTEDPTDNPDMTVTLPGPPGTTFTTSMKIIDTVQGNSDPGGMVPVGTLGGAGVVASIGGQITPPQIPYIYRIEVQTQDNTKPRERSRYSVLYGY